MNNQKLDDNTILVLFRQKYISNLNLILIVYKFLLSNIELI